MENEININGKKYREVDASGEKLSIVIADNRGLTFVGRFDMSQDSDFIPIRDARCIIRWGTTRHIAEIVDGPTDKTVLGAKQTVFVQRKNIVAVYACGGGWNE